MTTLSTTTIKMEMGEVAVTYDKKDFTERPLQLVDLVTTYLKTMTKEKIAEGNSTHEIDIIGMDKYIFTIDYDTCTIENRKALIVILEVISLRENITIPGHKGTWYIIDTNDEYEFKEYHLLESEQYGDMSPCIIVDNNFNIILEDVQNGFEDLEEYLDNL